MNREWVAGVQTISTFHPPNTFNQPADVIAEIMARPEVSPLGLSSGIRMILYYANRGGKNVSKERRETLREAVELLKQKPPIVHPLVAWKELPNWQFFILPFEQPRRKLYIKVDSTGFCESVVTPEEFGINWRQETLVYRVPLNAHQL